MEFTVDVAGVKNLQAKLEKLNDSLQDWTVAMNLVGQQLTDYFASVPVASRGSVFGQTWPALSPSYKEWKAEQYPGRPMMVLTGELMRSYEFQATGDFVRIHNTDTEKFRKHQQGIGVPQRTLMALNQDVKDMSYDALVDELQRKVNDL